MAKNSIFDPTKDGVKADNSGYSSNQIDKMIGQSAAALIDDDASGDDTVYSSAKIYSLLPEDTATGASVTITDACPDLPVVDVETEEGATKVFHAGKNILPNLVAETTSREVIFTPLADGGIHLSGTATGGTAVIDLGRTEELVLPAGTYYCNASASPYTITVYDVTSGTASVLKSGGGNFTISESKKVFVRVGINNGTSTDVDIYIQLEVGSSDSDFEAYKGTIYDAADADDIKMFGTLDYIYADSGDVTVTYKKLTTLS